MNVEISDIAPYNFNISMEFAGLYIVVEDTVLLMEKSDNRPTKGLWGIPGGKLDHNENPKLGLIREILEETGLLFTEEEIVYDEKLYVRREVGDFIFHTFQLRLDYRPEITLSDEHQGYGWFTYEQAKALPLFPGALICYERIL